MPGSDADELRQRAEDAAASIKQLEDRAADLNERIAVAVAAQEYAEAAQLKTQTEETSAQLEAARADEAAAKQALQAARAAARRAKRNQEAAIPEISTLVAAKRSRLTNDLSALLSLWEDKIGAAMHLMGSALHVASKNGSNSASVCVCGAARSWNAYAQVNHNIGVLSQPASVVAINQEIGFNVSFHNMKATRFGVVATYMKPQPPAFDDAALLKPKEGSTDQAQPPEGWKKSWIQPLEPSADAKGATADFQCSFDLPGVYHVKVRVENVLDEADAKVVVVHEMPLFYPQDTPPNIQPSDGSDTLPPYLIVDCGMGRANMFRAGDGWDQTNSRVGEPGPVYLGIDASVLPEPEEFEQDDISMLQEVLKSDFASGVLAYRLRRAGLETSLGTVPHDRNHMMFQPDNMFVTCSFADPGESSEMHFMQRQMFDSFLQPAKQPGWQFTFTCPHFHIDVSPYAHSGMTPNQVTAMRVAEWKFFSSEQKHLYGVKKGYNSQIQFAAPLVPIYDP